jgi:hypothetical protein
MFNHNILQIDGFVMPDKKINSRLVQPVRDYNEEFQNVFVFHFTSCSSKWKMLL